MATVKAGDRVRFIDETGIQREGEVSVVGLAEKACWVEWVDTDGRTYAECVAVEELEKVGL